MFPEEPSPVTVQQRAGQRPPAEFLAQIRAELEVFRRVVREQKLTLD
jgi:hypothetical protein